MLEFIDLALQSLAQVTDAAAPAASNAVGAAMSTTPDLAGAASAAGAPAAAADLAAHGVSAPALVSMPGMAAPVEPPATGFLHFISQSDIVGKSLFGILILMSLISWYLIVVKLIMHLRLKRRSSQFLREFWAASSLEQVENEIATHGANEPFAHLASHAIHARNHHVKYGAMRLEEKGSTGAFVTRTIRKVIDEETAKLENGLTMLASIGSTAPFVGLFGTVWGVYHALVGIGLSDGVTINRIAGPVGEALIMTGLGLAVAIPAVLAYNGFVRSNRVYLASLDAFAHDLFTFLSTGQQVSEGQANGSGNKLRRVSVATSKGE
ncbi:MotA/TolQ/ExbB proton channel family protein [Yanghanlia caeni]|uniref:Biopolymer transport protein ExbB n=1 Tax=Yanghanlia caeni TaxID=3064283 RepID=A0ABU1D6F8_9BURK|nr:MotA/TolQ/ExbB proton channel family protein [Alcaligenaceae bacterium LG-2]NGR09598.1 MotA/TolQ/ExbB proton channel family protein [bacterium SGD-2]HZH55891.1 MotA/TolQ/ExbB proton channel family protein [Burkholderiaceae bacterium]